MSESVWVLGAAMTKIARYDDKDVVDLAAEATFDALDDAGVSIFDVQVLAAGSLFTQGGVGQQIAKQVGQTGVPIYNFSNACATARPRSAPRSCRSRPMSPTSGSRWAASRWARWASSAARGRRKPRARCSSRPGASMA